MKNASSMLFVVLFALHYFVSFTVMMWGFFLVMELLEAHTFSYHSWYAALCDGMPILFKWNAVFYTIQNVN